MRNLLAGMGLALLALGSGWAFGWCKFSFTGSPYEKPPVPTTAPPKELPAAALDPLPAADTHVEKAEQNVQISAPRGRANFTRVTSALAQLLARHRPARTAPKICFVGLENNSPHELGDFKDELETAIREWMDEAKSFEPIGHRITQAGLRAARLRPDELFLPTKQQLFLKVMDSQGASFDDLLFATITSRPTRSAESARFALRLELVDVKTNTPCIETVALSNRDRKESEKH